MPLCDISIVEAGGIISKTAIPAAAAAEVRFDCHPVAKLEFVDSLSEAYNGSSVFMPQYR
jgi:hypothetical protein